ncbi:MAG TPA: pilus assembly protein N-terminal domain-containing protein [Candidatus Eisenbacteria bacterium]|nr:pilus assembly protein N-terminal domain-containing protein [Candidatus Eisenbacteria bacterium]
MFSRKMKSAMRSGVAVLLALVACAAMAQAQAREKIRIPLGRGEVVSSTEDVRTVAIAEPKIADATVGSGKTVVVTAKSVGITTLVVYNEGARYKVYDVEVYIPNGTKQVALHVRVAEVNTNAKKEYGFDWLGQGFIDGDFLQGGLYTTKVSDPSIPLNVGPGTDGFLHFEPGSGNWLLQTQWKALEESGDLRTLANSTLMAKSGEKATFLSGGEFAIPISSGSVAGGSTVTIEWKEFGVKLNFTPTVEEDNSITLKVAPEVSQIDFSSSLRVSGFVVPTLISRKASTVVNLNAGEHLVIGGLKQTDKVKSVKRVPVLGHIPLLGFFFTNKRTEDVEHDLLVVVSPELVAAASSSLPALPTDRRQE